MGTRTRVAIGLIAAAVAASAVALMVHSRGSDAPVRSKQVALARLERFDDAVVLRSPATADAVRAVTSDLDRSSAVLAYAPIDSSALGTMLVTHPSAANTEVLTRLCVNPNTRTFAVVLARTVRDAHRQLTRAVASEVNVLDIGEDIPDLEVSVDPHASVAATSALRRRLASDPDVVKNTVMDEPLSFRLQLRDGVRIPTVQDRYQHDAAVGTVTPRSNGLWSHANPVKVGPEIELFMEVKESKAQVDAVRSRLKQDPRVKRYRYIDHNDAYREFKKLFADQPVIVENETPAGLPTSFRVTLRSMNEVASATRDYDAAPGVRQVNSPFKSCASP